MNKLKDIIYDKSDLFTALIILIIAGLVIYSRIGTIMDYPEILAAQVEPNNSVNTEQTTDAVDENNKNIEVEKDDNSATEEKNSNKKTVDKNDNADKKDDAKQDKTEDTTASKKSKVSIQIDPGVTGSEIAQTLIDSGLIESKKEFYDAMKIAGADTRLKAGSFSIPSNASPDQIIKIITE